MRVIAWLCDELRDGIGKEIKSYLGLRDYTLMDRMTFYSICRIED